MNVWLLNLLLFVLLPTVLADLMGWYGILARRLIASAAARIPVHFQERYIEEWTAELEAVEGRQLSMLLMAVWVRIGATRTGRVLERYAMPTAGDGQKDHSTDPPTSIAPPIPLQPGTAQRPIETQTIRIIQDIVMEMSARGIDLKSEEWLEQLRRLAAVSEKSDEYTTITTRITRTLRRYRRDK